MSSFVNLLFNGYFIEAIAVLVAIILSIVIHEISHGYVALWNGDTTAKNNGRLTLNPVKHFDPLGFAMLALVGFGWAKPVPVNSNNFRKYKKGLFTVAIAGVTANLILAFFSYAFYLLIEFYLTVPYLNVFLAWFFWGMFQVNLVLIVFNLIPVFPLDGFRVVEALTHYKNKYTKFMYEYGSYILLGLLLSIYVLSYANIYVIEAVAGFIGWPIVQFWNLIF